MMHIVLEIEQYLLFIIRCAIVHVEIIGMYFFVGWDVMTLPLPCSAFHKFQGNSHNDRFGSWAMWPQTTDAVQYLGFLYSELVKNHGNWNLMANPIYIFHEELHLDVVDWNCFECIVILVRKCTVNESNRLFFPRYFFVL